MGYSSQRTSKVGRNKVYNHYEKAQANLGLFGKDTLGWKLLFDNDQVSDLKNLFAKYAPDIEINDM